MKLDNITFLILGVFSSFFGIMVFLSPIQSSGKYGVINFGSHHELIGVAIIAFGVICIYSAIRKKK